MKHNEKQPKFKIGDIVVISTSKTVGTITEVKKLNGVFFYRVNNSDNFFLESSLMSLSTYQASQIQVEYIEIEYKYTFGDLVFVAGYRNEIFKVVGVRTEIWRYKDGAWEEIIYELSRLSDGEWLEAIEEELTLIADSENAESFLQKLAFLYLVKKEQKSLEMHDKMMDGSKKPEKEISKMTKEKREIIDGLLDIYNDYKWLFEMFGDEKYKQVMETALRNLKRYTTDKKQGDS